MIEARPLRPLSARRHTLLRHPLLRLLFDTRLRLLLVTLLRLLLGTLHRILFVTRL